MTRLPIIITIGHGIGPEIVAKWLPMTTPDWPVWLVGNVSAVQAFQPEIPGHLTLIPVDGSEGEQAYQSLVFAVSAIAAGNACGLVTGPISKAALWQAGYTQYSGHTEILADLANTYWPSPQPHQSDMLFVHQGFRLLLLTRHVPLANVSTVLNRVDTIQSLTALVRFLQTRCHITQPNLALLGVNPHAGEIGGSEERDVLIPASCTVMEQLACKITPPLAADGFFRGFNPLEPGCDAVVAPYHDQGLIPFKLLAGWQAVNVTIGLPFLRTSVSHGTAPDIVGKNLAVPDSLTAAVACLKQWVAV